jgi:hypothetical protein
MKHGNKGDKKREHRDKDKDDGKYDAGQWLPVQQMMNEFQSVSPCEALALPPLVELSKWFPIVAGGIKPACRNSGSVVWDWSGASRLSK